MAALLMKSDQAETLLSILKSVMLKALQIFQLPQSWWTHSRLYDSIRSPFPVPQGVGRSLREGTRACEPLQSLTSQPPVNSASGGRLFSQPIPQSDCRFEDQWRGVLYGKLSSLGCFSKSQIHTPFLKAIHLTWAISPAFSPDHVSSHEISTRPQRFPWEIRILWQERRKCTHVL